MLALELFSTSLHIHSFVVCSNAPWLSLSWTCYFSDIIFSNITLFIKLTKFLLFIALLLFFLKNITNIIWLSVLQVLSIIGFWLWEYHLQFKRRYHTQLEIYSEFAQSVSHDIHPIGHDRHKTTPQMDVAASGHDEAYACAEVQYRMLRENVTHPATRITGRRKNRATWVTRREKNQWRNRPFSHASPSTDTQPLPLLLLNSTFVLGTIGFMEQQTWCLECLGDSWSNKHDMIKSNHLIRDKDCWVQRIVILAFCTIDVRILSIFSV